MSTVYVAHRHNVCTQSTELCRGLADVDWSEYHTVGNVRQLQRTRRVIYLSTHLSSTIDRAYRNDRCLYMGPLTLCSTYRILNSSHLTVLRLLHTDTAPIVMTHVSEWLVCRREYLHRNGSRIHCVFNEWKPKCRMPSVDICFPSLP